MSVRSIAVIGPPDSAIAGHVAERAAEAGIEVRRVDPAPPEVGAIAGANAHAAAGGVAGPTSHAAASDLAGTIADAVAGTEACVDAFVARTPEREAWMAAIEAALPDSAPIVVCCHAGSATAAAAAAAHPERVVGFGLLPPCSDRATVELARALQTSDPAFEAAAELWRRLGHTPVPVGDGAGLVVARVVACLANEAAFTAMEHVAAPRDIDLAMRLGTGYPRGPLEWCDLVGARDILATLDALAAEHGEDRFRAAPLLRRMAAAGATWEEVHDRR